MYTYFQKGQLYCDRRLIFENCVFLKQEKVIEQWTRQNFQALYNIVDSLFVGRYSDSGLTALSIIYPLQLLMIALAVAMWFLFAVICWLIMPVYAKMSTDSAEVIK